LAGAYKITSEVLLPASLEDWISAQNSEFEDTAGCVLKQNVELNLIQIQNWSFASDPTSPPAAPLLLKERFTHNLVKS